MTVALAVVHPGTITYGWHESVLGTLRAMPGVQLISVQSGALISRARNKVLELFLGTDCDHLLFTDSDMVWEPEATSRLLEVNAPIVSAAYYGKGSGGEVFPVASLKDDRGLARLNEFPDTGVFEVFGVGMGFCLIKREVVEALTPIKKLWPYAEIEYGREALGEDVTFCMRAAKKGFKSYLDPRVRVGHTKQVVI